MGNGDSSAIAEDIRNEYQDGEEAGEQHFSKMSILDSD
jgi:hypothetical protein